MELLAELKNKKTVRLKTVAGTKEEFKKELINHLTLKDSKETCCFECKEGIYPYDMVNNIYIKIK